MLRILILAVFVGLAATPGQAASRKSWTIGEPIVTYWAGPGGFLPVNDQTASQLRAGGWNLAWAETPEDIEVYHRHGLRVMLVIRTPNVDDPAQAGRLQALVEKVRDHPAMYAYYLVDEPGAGAFPMLGKLVAFLRRHDPAHLAFINLFPTYANEAQLSVTNDAAARARVGYPTDFAGINTSDATALRYREHLRQFIQIVKPDLISYDHYHFLKDRDGVQYFLNLALIRGAALKAGKPFMNIIQTCDSPAEGWRGPNENELRWLTWTSLAYGAQGIAHFRYDTGLWQDPKEATQPLPLYWSLAQINREFVAAAAALQGLKSLGAYHFGAVPQGALGPPKSVAFAPVPAKQGVLLGYFGRSAGRPTHVVAVNLDYRKPARIVLSGPGAMEMFHAATGVWSARSASGRVTLELPPGGGAVVRLAR